MTLTRFALLAVVTVALASLTEALQGHENACGVALRPDNFEQVISEWKADCESSNRKRKCMAGKHGWVTDAGDFDEAAFRAYIADKIANQEIDDPQNPHVVPTWYHVKMHIEGALDGCLTAKNMEKFRIQKIMSCLMKDC